MFGKKLGATGRIVAGLALAGASLALTAVSAHAQEFSRYGGTTTDSITVYGPHRYVTQPTTGARVRMDGVSTVVPLGDLDLSTPYGARIAKVRIVQAARDVCEEAEYVYPKDGDPPGGCYSNAVRQGMRAAQDMAGYPIVAWGYH